MNTSLILSCVAVILFLLASVIWWNLPLYQKSRLSRSSPSLSDSERETLEDEYRKTVTQALGGIFLVLTLIVAFMQLNAAQETNQSQLHTSERNTDAQVRESQFSKGFDLLGSNSSGQRIGGIHLLDEWARDSSFDDKTTVDNRYDIIIPSLVALVRAETEFKDKDSTQGFTTSRCEEFIRPDSIRVPEDVQVALKRDRTLDQVEITCQLTL